MAELPFSETEAEKYVLGQLAPAERREFEARLGQSPELRALVRELEEGLAALALAAPQHRAPREAWQNIQSKITPPSGGNLLASLAGLKWLLNGWGVATCITAVLILKIAWPHLATTAANAAGKGSSVAMAGSNASSGTTGSAVNSSGASAGPPSAADIVRAGIASRSTPVDRNTEEMMSQPGGAAGLQLVPPDKSLASSHMNLSPQMQRAMLLAVAKQMGWSIQKPPSTTAPPAEAPGLDGIATSDPGQDPAIDFIYLPSESPVAAPDQPAGSGTSTTELFALSQGPDSGSLPVLPSGPDVFAFVDPAGLPPKTGSLTVWVSDTDGNGVSLGTVHIHHPTVIVLPALATGYQYFITAGSASNILGRYPSARDLEMQAQLETGP